jgi:hypothetical protein
MKMTKKQREELIDFIATSAKSITKRTLTKFVVIYLTARTIDPREVAEQITSLIEKGLAKAIEEMPGIEEDIKKAFLEAIENPEC